MKNGPEKIIVIALDDYLRALEPKLKATTFGILKDELSQSIPNMLKDESKRVKYDSNNQAQHVSIFDPEHEVKVIRIKEELL